MARAQATTPAIRAAALDDLCRAYRQPLYAFVRRLGKPPTEAEELVQAFFDDFLTREGFERAQAERGRLRSYLLGSLKVIEPATRHPA